MAKNEKTKEKSWLNMDNVTVNIGRVEKDNWEEEMGPQPKPGLTDLRNWDLKLLDRYEPFYTPVCDMCCHCSYGKCDLSKGKRGACGIDLRTQQARQIALESAIGTAAHGAHAHHMLEHQVERLGFDYQIDMGLNVDVEAPIFRTIIGKKPESLGDLEEGLEYAEAELQNVLSSIHMGQEGNYKDYESKALHVGMLDNLVKEIGDIAQIIGYDFPKGDPDAPLADLGAGTIDKKKPMILIIGHNVAPGAEIITYAEAYEKLENVEVAGICCSAHDLQRKNPSAKIIGPLSEQLRFIRSGMADVVVVDEQCVRTDVLQEAQKVGAPVIATNDKMGLGLPDRTGDDPEQIVEDLISGKDPGALLLNPKKVGEVSVRLSEKIAEKRKKKKAIPTPKELNTEVARCVDCQKCRRSCPVDLNIPAALAEAKNGSTNALAELKNLCVGCGRCESACPKDIKIVSLMEKAAEKLTKEEKYKVRTGRGPIQDKEIRNVGAPIVFGEIPGVVAFAGCSNYSNGGVEVAEMAEEFLKRNFIVVASGCAAMSIARNKDEDGQTLYEKYEGAFDAGGLVNVGSCVANAHILGAAIKIPTIFAKRPMRGNFEEIADYILNRVGAVGVVWGPMSQKALSIGTGINRWGVPTIMGPTGSKYRRLYLGRDDKKEDWQLFDAKTGDTNPGEPAPTHLAYVAESKEEAMVMIAKEVMRPNDTTKGRQIKLAHYIDLHKKYFGTMPKDLHKYIRMEQDIPMNMKEEIKEIIKKEGWEPRKIPDPTIVERLVRKPVKKEAGK